MITAQLKNRVRKLEQKINSLSSETRNDVIELCAKTAEEFYEDDKYEGQQIAEEIRKLKDAPTISTEGDR